MIGISRQNHSVFSWPLHGGVLLLFVMLFCGSVGCGGAVDEQQDRDRKQMKGITAVTGQRARAENLSRDGFMVETADLNEDEQPDQWVIKDNVRTQRIERDLNFDGKVDLWQYPDEKGSIVEEEMDLDQDGNVDVVVFYDNGVVTRKEMSIDFQGDFSIVKFYDKAGGLLRVERDEDADGDVDVWEYYEKGQRVRVGWDEDSDGQPDLFDTFE